MKKLKKYNLSFLAIILALPLLFASCSDDNPVDPTAEYTYEISTDNTLMVTFDVTATNGRTLTWDFGDGAYSIAKSPIHTFPAAGTYNVKLIVSGEDGSTPAVVEKTITVIVPVFEPVTVENAEFELPGTPNRIKDWATIPGWSSDATTADSGVEKNGWWASGNTTFCGVLFTGDVSVYNKTTHVITAGEKFKVDLKAFDIWNGPKIIASIIYIKDDGSRHVIQTQTFNLTSSQWNTIELNATATPDSVGSKLGIEFDNLSGDGGDGWTGFDSIELFAK